MFDHHRTSPLGHAPRRIEHGVHGYSTACNARSPKHASGGSVLQDRGRHYLSRRHGGQTSQGLLFCCLVLHNQRNSNKTCREAIGTASEEGNTTTTNTGNRKRGRGVRGRWEERGRREGGGGRGVELGGWERGGS